MATNGNEADAQESGQTAEAELIGATERYLESLHCSSWGQSMSVYTPAGRHQAALWLMGVYRGVAAHLGS